MTKPNHELSPALIVLMSIATGLAVASNYYAQPLLDTIARNFSLSASSAGFIVTAAQLGYAAGLLFLVPLGDMFERRRLIVSMTLLAAGGMLITASSQSLAMMILGTALTGYSLSWHKFWFRWQRRWLHRTNAAKWLALL